MDTRTGQIFQLKEGEAPGPNMRQLTEAEAAELLGLPLEDRLKWDRSNPERRIMPSPVVQAEKRPERPTSKNRRPGVGGVVGGTFKKRRR